MDKIEELRKGMVELAESKRINAGNNIMNYITEYFLEQQKYYREEYGKNYIEAMRQDKIWILENSEFNELMRKYFELTIG